MKLGLGGKRCVVTGASRGIGAMVARELAAEGADLALLARSEPALVELAGELEGRHQVRTRPVPVDLSTAEGAASGMDQAIEVLGGIDVLHLTKTLAELLASDGITVVAVNPGLTETDRVRDAMRTWADDEGVEPDTYARDYASRLPLRRLAAPEEVARVVVVMASDLSEYVTGSAVQVDGASSRGAF